MSKIKKYIPILIIVILSICAWQFGLQHYFNFSALKNNQTLIESYILNHYALSLLIYSSIYILIVGLSIPGATFMTLIGGLLFGQLVGTCVVVISATFGATLLFISARQATQNILKKKAGPWVAKMQKGFQENAAFYLLTLRLVPLFPFVAINLVAAILEIPLRTFFFVTLFGIIPGSFVYVSLGVAMREVINKPNFSPNIILDPKILIALTGLAVLSLLPVLYKLYKNKQ
jgi:uncharacterized membrane protein YdjX (TVP38/TMEM64 family)